MFFPAARKATVLSTPSSPASAPPTFRAVPGVRRCARDRTEVPGLFLAGAWCDTGWPATMEGAVRSGREAAAHALARSGRATPVPSSSAHDRCEGQRRDGPHLSRPA